MRTSVLVVGAGPVGLFLACELVRRGVSCRIIDAGHGPSTTSKALGVMPRTLEIMQIAGLSERFASAGQACPRVVIATPKRTLASVSFADLESDFPSIAMVPQNTTEAIFTDRLRELGVAVEYDTRLVTFEQRADRVVATLRTPAGEEQRVEASYLCGCDGARSTVREALGIAFRGSEYPEKFLLADLVADLDLPEDTLFLYPGKAGPLAIFPMGNHRRRIVAVAENQTGDVTERELRQLFAERGPRLGAIRELIWTSRFSIHRRSAAAMQMGRAFLLGDAAHIHSPFGAQGMNTGLGDAWNLAWKLAAVIGERSPSALLASFEAERLRVAHDVLRQTDAITRVMASPNAAVDALRGVLLPKIAKTRLFQDVFTHQLSEIAVHYAHSPIVEGHGGRVTQQSAGIIGPPGTLNAELAGGAFVIAAQKNALVSDGVLERLETVCGRYDGRVAVLESGVNPKLAPLSLVRPDGYCAGTFSPRELDGMARLMSRQLLAATF